MTGRLRAVATVLLSVGVLSQLVAGQGLMLVSPGWLVKPPPSWPLDAVATPYMGFVRAHLPPGQVLILVTAQPATAEFYRLSSDLAGRNPVYWLAPGIPHRPPDWWQPTDGSAADLLLQAQHRGSAYLAFDGLDPPPGLRLRRLLVFARLQSLGWLQPT